MDPAKCAITTNGGTYAASSTHPGTYDANIAANSGRIVQNRCKAEHKQLIKDHFIEKAGL
eukprot:15366038-Ditylum_brightwellii.AAC.1